MALGVKKITESVIENNRALTTIGNYMPMEDYIDVNDNSAIDEGGLFTATSASGGIIRMKDNTCENNQARINADRSIEYNSITSNLLIKSCVITDKIKDNNVTIEKLSHELQNLLKDLEAKVRALSDELKNIKDVLNLLDKRVTNLEIDMALLKERLDKLEKALKELENRLMKLIKELQDRITALEEFVKNEIARLEKMIIDLENKLKLYIDSKFENIEKQLNNVVFHDGMKSVGSKYGGTELINLHCTGDIEGNRVYFMTYQDLAEAYIPGEDMQPGDIVAMREDGLVYKANAFDQCIVGVISNEFANCLGATAEEIKKGSKVAVGTIGKIHVNVRGPVKLGQQIHVMGADSGVGSASWTTINSIGKALETIECGTNEINKVLVQIRPM